VAEWQDAPPAPAKPGRKSQYNWPKIVADLKARPGQWMQVDETARRSLATAIRGKKMTALRDPNWEFHVKTVNNNTEAGTAEVWMSAERKQT
jgi:hypothetical protein